MNRHFPQILTLILALVAGSILAADTTNRPPRPPAPEPVKTDAKVDFQSFRLITERNIFNMSRSGRVSRTRSAPVKQVITDSFSLLGTMSYEQGKFAFFDGSSSEYGKTLKLADVIGGYKIAAIENDYVQLLATNDQTLQMPVGAEMRRRDGGPWTLGRASGSSYTSSTNGRMEGDRRSSGASRNRMSPTGGGPDAVEPKPDTSSGGSAEDVIKRLMEKRAREEQSGK